VDPALLDLRADRDARLGTAVPHHPGALAGAWPERPPRRSHCTGAHLLDVGVKHRSHGASPACRALMPSESWLCTGVHGANRLQQFADECLCLRRSSRIDPGRPYGPTHMPRQPWRPQSEPAPMPRPMPRESGQTPPSRPDRGAAAALLAVAGSNVLQRICARPSRNLRGSRNSNWSMSLCCASWNSSEPCQRLALSSSPAPPPGAAPRTCGQMLDAGDLLV